MEEKKEKIERGFKRSMTTLQWIKLAVIILIYIAWVIWLGNPLWIIGIPLLADIYWTRFIPWKFWKKWENGMLKSAMDWIDAVAFALVAVYFINTFFFQNYQIPTSSLEKSLLVGDYLFVSKMSYGPRIPMTPLSFPLAQHTMPWIGGKSYIDHPQLPYRRLKGFGNVERDQIVVFNFPAGDTVALNMQYTDYYTLAYYNGGEEAIKRNPSVYGEVVYRPVDRRENYVKRCIGLPGDTLSIVNNQVMIDGKAIKNPKEMQLNYYVETNGALFNNSIWLSLGVNKDDRAHLDENAGINVQGKSRSLLEYIGFKPNAKGKFNPVYRMPLTQEGLAKVKAMNIVTQVIVEPGFMGGETYPLGYNPAWTRSNYGPIYIPQKGATIQLNADNYALYERCIRNYERHKLEKKGNTYFIDGKEATSYTFEMDYYWMMGDNRDNSADSRSWGFVPEDHIIGRPIFVWLSIEKDNGSIRTERLFMNAKNL